MNYSFLTFARCMLRIITLGNATLFTIQKISMEWCQDSKQGNYQLHGIHPIYPKGSRLDCAISLSMEHVGIDLFGTWKIVFDAARVFRRRDHSEYHNDQWQEKKDDCEFKTNKIATLQLLRFISHAWYGGNRTWINSVGLLSEMIARYF